MTLAKEICKRCFATAAGPQGWQPVDDQLWDDGMVWCPHHPRRKGAVEVAGADYDAGLARCAQGPPEWCPLVTEHAVSQESLI